MNITGIARENFEEAGLPLKNTIELTTMNIQSPYIGD